MNHFLPKHLNTYRRHNYGLSLIFLLLVLGPARQPYLMDAALVRGLNNAHVS